MSSPSSSTSKKPSYPGGTQRANDLPQGHDPIAQAAAILLALGRAFRVAKLHQGDLRGDLRNPLHQARILAQVVGVQQQFHLRTVDGLDNAQGIVEIVEERALGRTARVHRLQGHHHAEFLGQRHQFLERSLDESPRVVEGVAGPRAAAHDQAPGPQGRGRPQGVGRVFHAFAIAVALAAREPPRPEQVRNLEVVLADQFHRAVLAAIGKLLPPDADGLDARRGIMGHVVFERPAKGRGFVQGQDCHPCRLRERETLVWRIVGIL